MRHRGAGTRRTQAACRHSTDLHETGGFQRFQVGPDGAAAFLLVGQVRHKVEGARGLELLEQRLALGRHVRKGALGVVAVKVADYPSVVWFTDLQVVLGYPIPARDVLRGDVVREPVFAPRKGALPVPLPCRPHRRRGSCEPTGDVALTSPNRGLGPASVLVLGAANCAATWRLYMSSLHGDVVVDGSTRGLVSRLGAICSFGITVVVV